MENVTDRDRDYLNFNEQQQLPNSTAVLVLGILSIVLCSPLGIIALVLAHTDTRRYRDNPGVYSADSYNSLKAGKICSIIGVSILGLILLFYAVVFIFAISYR